MSARMSGSFRFALFISAAVACSQPGVAPPVPAVALQDSLTVAESIYTDARTLKDRLGIAVLRGLTDTAKALRGPYLAARRALALALSIDSLLLADSVDRRALRVMRHTFATDLADIPEPPGAVPPDSAGCDYDPHSIADPDSWVFASYAVGGFDNFGELLHEIGHGIHIAGIRTRPAFSDWPDADLFTEAIADLALVEAYESRWQQRYLGDSAHPRGKPARQVFRRGDGCLLGAVRSPPAAQPSG